ncbi:hypothetical protein GCM10010394_57480 [Streptomyces crystallinus]|uniref:Uncharacterized protein n=1 Tax=Streptomyces crystallinus TaxID=68191 RepID=A0ABN1GU32_9ACTN
MVRAVCSRSSASLGFAVSERAVRSSTGPLARMYEANDGYGVAAREALLQTGVVIPPR